MIWEYAYFVCDTKKQINKIPECDENCLHTSLSVKNGNMVHYKHLMQRFVDIFEVCQFNRMAAILKLWSPF